MRNISFDPGAFEDYIDWSKTNRKIFDKINKLCQQISRTPFSGEGKPEPLKGNLKGCWSVRIDKQNRIVYIVSDKEVKIISCRGHYD